MGSNLPPGVTPSDIDKHFGAPEYHTEDCEAILDVVLTEDVDPTDLLDVTLCEYAQIVHVEDIEQDGDEFIKAVYVAFEVETQYQDADDIRRDARKQFSVTPNDERVSSVEYVEIEVR